MARQKTAIGLLAAAFITPDLSSDLLEQIIRTKNIATAEQLLAELPQEALAQHTFLYRSRSLHGADFNFPRALVFGTDGKFILTFNGKLGQAHFYSFDILEFNETTSTYSPIEVKFDPQGVNLAVVDRQPAVCVLCHGTSIGVQPLRSKYLSGIFPGIYGSVQDRVTPAESVHLQEFLATSRNQWRYQFLPAFMAPRFWPSQDPNHSLGIILNERHFEGIAKKLSMTPELFKFRYALLAAVECAPRFDGDVIPGWDPDISNYLSDATKAGFRKTLAQYGAESKLSQENKLMTSLRERTFFLNADEPILDSTLQSIRPRGEGFSAALSYIVQEVAHDAALIGDIKAIDINGADRGGGTANLARALYKLVLASPEDAELLRLHRDYESTLFSGYYPFEVARVAGTRICPMLKERSLAQ